MTLKNVVVNGDDDPNFSDPEDYIDRITDEELLGDILSIKPKEADGIQSVVVVDNVPVVGKDRLEKLQNVIRKIFSRFGDITNEFYPTDESGQTKGYIFIEYAKPLHAQNTVTATNGYKLDKHHTFIVNLFTDFDKYEARPEDIEVPKAQSYKDPGNLRSWLLNDRCMDQYCVVYEGGEKTAVFQNGKEPVKIEERPRWTESYVRWSPQGTYLATFHQRGIALWGGERFQQIMKFAHPGVQFIDFSHCEKYIVTFSPIPIDKKDPQTIIIWDIRTGQKRRGFQSEGGSSWPIFKWNHDGSYFARLSHDAISVYETPSFGLLDKKSIKIEGAADFCWSTTDNYISYWVREHKDVPARLSLMEIPSRKELRSKILFNVADCKMHWQKNGNFLGCKIDKYSKKKEEDGQVKHMGMSYTFEIFHIREKLIPVDTVEIKDPISAFAWEPNGPKFAVVHGESPRISVSFYAVHPKCEKLKTFEKKMCNHLFWSPNGQFIVLAGLRNMNGVLEFVDASEMVVMNAVEHFMASDVEWDPTGRYLITTVSYWQHKMDNAYWVWSFQGRLLQKQALDKCCLVLWRPRPHSLLSQDEIKKVRKNMKKYNQQLAREDEMDKAGATKEQLERRHKQKRSFLEYRERVEQVWAEEKKLRMALRNGVDTDVNSESADNEQGTEVVEFLLNEEQFVIDNTEE